MQVYLVGGAVRDKLLGLPVKERDWVVVGATPDEMQQQGYIAVGKDFPVFLHPQTKEEYALARTETKVAAGYRGFKFRAAKDVTLEQDLKRRDLTINAIAEDKDGNIIDPFNGTKDLQAKVLRHVSDAFAEDPVRILRVARFLARFHQFDFKIAPKTYKLMQKMAAAGEVDALVPERVFKELSRALEYPHPLKFFEVLLNCNALEKIMPQLSLNHSLIDKLNVAVESENSAPQKMAAIVLASLNHNVSDFYKNLDENHKLITQLSKRLRLPHEYKNLMVTLQKHAATILQPEEVTAEKILQLLEAANCIHNDKQLQQLLDVVLMLAKFYEINIKKNFLAVIIGASILMKVDAAPLISQGLSGNALGDAMRKIRLQRILSLL